MDLRKETTIHIWQGERDILDFMYKPVVQSIIYFFESSPRDVPRERISYRINCREWDTLKKGDVFVWVGCDSIPNFSVIRERGIYTVYYNTEPFREDVASDEIWTYSRFMYSEISKTSGSQVVKFLPVICEKGMPRVRYGEEPVSNHIVFLGNLIFRDEKLRYFTPDFRNAIIEKLYLWHDDTYNAFLHGTPYIYLNLTKLSTVAMPSVRVNKLLSHGAIIISENVHAEDQAEYEGLVFFGDLTQLEGIFRGLLEKSGKELREISDAIYKRFCSKFNGVVDDDRFN